MEANKNNKILYYPMLVSEDGTETPLEKQVEDMLWKKFRLLPKEKQDILVADEVPQKVKNLQDAFRLSETVIGMISLFIRKIFFGELTLQECEAKIGSILTTTNGGDPNQAKAIVEFIQKEILALKPKPKVEEPEEEEYMKIATASLPLLQALSKYENLGNQLITGERIRIKSQGEPVRPSLLYWLRYYRDELGIGQHNSVDRGQFLFRSENGRKLSHEERERLSLILKSIEENFPLQIDTERQEIIFPAFQGVLVPAQTASQNVAGREMPSVVKPETTLSDRPAFFQPQDMSKKNMSGSMHISPGLAFSNPREKEIGKIRPITPQSTGEVSFSANHFFPAEKEVIEKKAEAVQEKPIQTAQPAASVSPSTPPLPKITPVVPRTNTFNIRPVSFGRKD